MKSIVYRSYNKNATIKCCWNIYFRDQCNFTYGPVFCYKNIVFYYLNIPVLLVSLFIYIMTIAPVNITIFKISPCNQIKISYIQIFCSC